MTIHLSSLEKNRCKILIFGLLMFAMAACSGPPSSGKFETTGEFVSARYSGSLGEGMGEKYNTTGFLVLVTPEEFERVEKVYTDWQSKSSQVVDNAIRMQRNSTGNWCGPLPEEGRRVKISSPTGYTKDVVITDLQTNETFVSLANGDNCERPINDYFFRITNKETGEIINSGTVSGRDSNEAAFKVPGGFLGNDDYIFQIWEAGQDPPPPLK